MTKEKLLSLWNVDSWEVMSCGVYFTAHRSGKELHINCNDYTEAEILAMPFWERLAQELDELDRQAHEILQKEFPDDEDIPGLALTDITIDKSGCYGTFSLCYDTGDSPAGELYLNVELLTKWSQKMCTGNLSRKKTPIGVSSWPISTVSGSKRSLKGDSDPPLPLNLVVRPVLNCVLSFARQRCLHTRSAAF